VGTELFLAEGQTDGQGDRQTDTEFFYQLLTIHGLSNGHYVPLAFFLLANKPQTSYKNIFRRSVSEAAKLGVNVFPAIVYANFETAIHNAVIRVWPGCEVKSMATENTIFGTQQAVWKD
jgi:hypothetical protein